MDDLSLYSTIPSPPSIPNDALEKYGESTKIDLDETLFLDCSSSCSSSDTPSPPPSPPLSSLPLSSSPLSPPPSLPLSSLPLSSSPLSSSPLSSPPSPPPSSSRIRCDVCTDNNENDDYETSQFDDCSIESSNNYESRKYNEASVCLQYHFDDPDVNSIATREDTTTQQAKTCPINSSAYSEQYSTSSSPSNSATLPNSNRHAFERKISHFKPDSKYHILKEKLNLESKIWSLQEQLQISRAQLDSSTSKLQKLQYQLDKVTSREEEFRVKAEAEKNELKGEIEKLKRNNIKNSSKSTTQQSNIRHTKKDSFQQESTSCDKNNLEVNEILNENKSPRRIKATNSKKKKDWVYSDGGHMKQKQDSTMKIRKLEERIQQMIETYEQKRLTYEEKISALETKCKALTKRNNSGKKFPKGENSVGSNATTAINNIRTHYKKKMDEMKATYEAQLETVKKENYKKSEHANLDKPVANNDETVIPPCAMNEKINQKYENALKSKSANPRFQINVSNIHDTLALFLSPCTQKLLKARNGNILTSHKQLLALFADILKSETISKKKEISEMKQELDRANEYFDDMMRNKEQQGSENIQKIIKTSQDCQLRIIQLQNEVDALRNEKEYLKTHISSMSFNPELQKFATLSRKISIMEESALKRENELKEIVESSKSETRRLQRIHDEEIREKDEQIRCFSAKLQHLMYDIKKLALAREAKLTH